MQAYKNRHVIEPISSIIRVQNSKFTDKYSATFRMISQIEKVKTISGDMMLCKIDYLNDINKPTSDLIMFVGTVDVKCDAGSKFNTNNKPKLWFYNDKYWLNAKTKQNLEYRKNHRNLLYEVAVTKEVIDLGIMD